MSKQNEIIGLIMARDEWPLLELSVTHALVNHVDRVYVLNHASIDGTRVGLERLREMWGERLQILHLEDSSYLQEAATNLLLEVAKPAPNDWVYVFDADEFALTPTGVPLRDILALVNPDIDSVRYEINNWVSTHDFDEMDLEQFAQLHYRSVPNLFMEMPIEILSDEISHGNLNFFDIPFPSKVIFRGRQLGWVAAGAHGLKQSSAPSELKLDPVEFNVAHLPLLSMKRLALKVAQGEALIKSGFPYWHGWQNQLLYQLSKSGQLVTFWNSHSISLHESISEWTLPSVTIDGSFVHAIEPTLARLNNLPPSVVHPMSSKKIKVSGETLVSTSVAVHGIRMIQIVADALSAQVAEQEQSVQALTAQVAEKEQSVQALSAQVAEQEQTLQVLTAQLAERDAQLAEREQSVQELTAQVAQKEQRLSEKVQIIAQQDLLLNKANYEKTLFHTALQDIVNSKPWRMILLLQKIRQLFFSGTSIQARAVRNMRAIVRGVPGKFSNAALFINKGFHYIKKYGVKESFVTIKDRAEQERPTIKVDSSVLIPLQNILDHLNLSPRSEQVLTALDNMLGRERTGRVMANIVDVEKFIFTKNSGDVYPIIHASQLPLPSPQPRKRNILFITAEFPTHHHGGGNRVLNFIKTLSADNNIYLCSAFMAKEHEQHLAGLTAYCREILKIRYGQFGGNQDEIRSWLSATPVDIVHYEWPRSLENYDPGFGKIQIFTYMEAVSLRLLMDMECIPPLSAPWVEKFKQLGYALRLEIPQASRLDARVAVTTKDADFFRGIYPFQEYVILNHGLNFEEFTLPDGEAEPHTLVFVGNYLHYPNEEALEFFFNEIWENICKEIPDIRIYVVGTNPTDDLRSRSDGKRVIVTGTVADVRPYIQKASVCIAPLISGAGLRGKVIEYAALRRTFVATSIASTDLVFKDGIDYYCADTALEFSDRIITLLKDPLLARRMADTAYETAKRNYDNQRLTGFLLSLYEYLENRSDGK